MSQEAKYCAKQPRAFPLHLAPGRLGGGGGVQDRVRNCLAKGNRKLDLAAIAKNASEAEPQRQQFEGETEGEGKGAGANACSTSASACCCALEQ